MADKRPIELKEGWSVMQIGIEKLIKILEGEAEEQFNAEQYMSLYTTIYNMCTQKPPHDYSEQLYGLYKEAFNKYIVEKVMPSLQEHHDEVLLKELFTRWNNHKLMVRWLSRFFNYLDRYYVLRHSLNLLKDVGLLCFKDLVYKDIHVKTCASLLKLVEREREGELVDRALVKNILGIFIEVGMGGMECYEKDFEEHLLTTTRAFYKRKAADWIEQDSCPDYMLKAEECLRMEEERVDQYIHVATKPKLLKEVETEVLTTHQKVLLDKEHSGAAALLQDDKREDLARMYRLFSRVANGLTPVAEVFRAHVESQGSKLVKEVTEAMESKKEKDAAAKGPSKDAGSASEQQFVRSVIELHDKYLGYVSTCFCNSSLFHKALKDAFESFCNKSVAGSSSAELMASFCNNLLQKMEGMVTDLQLAREKQQNFDRWREENGKVLAIDLTVTVLTTGFWPTYKSTELALPREMVDGVETFKQFYETENKHSRKLAWIYSLGMCTLRGNFDKNPIELVLGTLQAACLLLFNDAQELTYQDIQERLNLPDDDITRMLHSLSCAKYKILAKDPVSKNISKVDKFSFNSKFTDRMRRIKVPLPPVDEKKKVIEDVDKDRKYAIDAAIVRTMKSRKQLQHQQLIMEVVQQLTRMFKPDFKLIKKRIEDLIQREYIERDKDNAQVFRYLA
ncbi:MAG: hypothetical protein WDW38_010572 [Sanguina aurantia]